MGLVVAFVSAFELVESNYYFQTFSSTHRIASGSSVAVATCTGPEQHDVVSFAAVFAAVKLLIMQCVGGTCLKNRFVMIVRDFIASPTDWHDGMNGRLEM